jgi:hypothetical protein
MFKAAVRGVIVSLVLALWAILVGGVSAVAAASPVTSGYEYGVSIRAYDAAGDGVRVDTGKAALTKTGRGSRRR